MGLDDLLELKDYKLSEEEQISKVSKQELVKNDNIRLEGLIRRICNQEDIGLGDIRKRSRVKRLSDIYKAIVVLSKRYCRTSNKRNF